jgi:hypothetical protein
MRQLKRKTTNPYSPDDRVRAWQSFGHATGTVRAGDVLRGDDPIVVEHHPWFEHVDTPTAERKNVWLEMPEPPQHTPEVAVQTIQIPPPRQVRCTVDVATSLAWSSGSPGAKSGLRRPSLVLSFGKSSSSMCSIRSSISTRPGFAGVSGTSRPRTSSGLRSSQGSSGKETRPSGDRQARVLWAPSDGPASDRRPRAQMAHAPAEPGDNDFLLPGSRCP